MGKYFLKKRKFTMSKKGGAKDQKKAPGAGFDAKRYERPGLSAEEVEEPKDAFDLFDVDNSGAISIAEFTGAMQSIGLDAKHESVFNMIKELDADGSGEIEFEEFLEMMTATMSHKSSREDVEKAFKLFDTDRTGEISLDNMKRVAQDLGEDVSPQDLSEIVNRGDMDKDGSFTMDDFYAVLTKKNY